MNILSLPLLPRLSKMRAKKDERSTEVRRGIRRGAVNLQHLKIGHDIRNTFILKVRRRIFANTS